MFEKVNPFHPDKVADRIAGAIVDLAYRKQTDPRIAVEVLLGHGKCNIIAESSAPVTPNDCHAIVQRIAGRMLTYTTIVPQDQHLADNQQGIVRCGDNGIFKGMPVNEEQHQLTEIAKAITEAYPFDGKYIINAQKHSMVLCQSNLLNKNWSYLMNDVLQKKTGNINDVFINPLGEWTGYNANSSEKRAHFEGMTMAQYMRWLWNNPQAGQSPYKMFEGVMRPDGEDENGDLIYYYDTTKTI